MPKRVRSKFASFSSINKKRRLAYAEKKEQLKNELLDINKENVSPVTMKDIQHLNSNTIYLVTNLQTNKQFITLDPYVRNVEQQIVYFPKIRDNSVTLTIPNFKICKFEPFQSQIDIEIDTVKKEKLISHQKMIVTQSLLFFGDDFIKMKITDNKENTKYVYPTEISEIYISGNHYNLNGECRKITIPLNKISSIKSYCE